MICSANQTTKFGSNDDRICHFEKYLKSLGIRAITFPYSSKSIADTTYSLDVPYNFYKEFKDNLGYFEISDVEFL